MTNLLSRTIPLTSIKVESLLWAIVIAVVGYVIIKTVIQVLRSSLTRIGVPELAAGVLARLVEVLLYAALVLAVAATLGYNTGSLVLGLSAIIGLVLGFGLQDTINNLAAGVWLAASRAFSKGDVVEVAGYKGVVEDVGILSTVLKTPENNVIMVPNKSVWGSAIVNYTKMPVKRISVDVGVAYGTDLDKAVKTALDVIRSIEGVLSDPEPQVIVTELADSSVNLQLRAWARREDYWAVREAIIKAVYRRFNEEGIEIPFPQLDVHVREFPRKTR
ncbi:MAG: mechanosensitive ion channel family protein [Desulfurococcales archaeon]|nr:mechanosensitive ion channel family protein [Desulfurococcales archaeon]